MKAIERFPDRLAVEAVVPAGSTNVRVKYDVYSILALRYNWKCAPPLGSDLRCVIRDLDPGTQYAVVAEFTSPAGANGCTAVVFLKTLTAEEGRRASTGGLPDGGPMVILAPAPAPAPPSAPLPVVDAPTGPSARAPPVDAAGGQGIAAPPPPAPAGREADWAKEKMELVATIARLEADIVGCV